MMAKLESLTPRQVKAFGLCSNWRDFRAATPLLIDTRVLHGGKSHV